MNNRNPKEITVIPHIEQIVDCCTHFETLIPHYNDSVAQDVERGDSIIAKIYAHVSASGENLLDYAILSLISEYSPLVEDFSSQFESYLRDGSFLLVNWWIDGSDFSKGAVASRLTALEQQGIIRRGQIEMQFSTDDSVLVFTRRLFDVAGPRYSVTELGASRWLHFEERVLDGSYYVSGWCKRGFVFVSKQPFDSCPFRHMPAEYQCPLYCRERSNLDSCSIGIIPKWQAAWWRPVTTGYVLICRNGELVEDSSLWPEIPDKTPIV